MNAVDYRAYYDYLAAAAAAPDDAQHQINTNH